MIDAFLDLFSECGPPDRLYLTNGFGLSRFRELAKERIAEGNRAIAPWPWRQLSEIVLRFTKDDLPYDTEEQQETLLDRYLHLIINAK